MTIHERLRTLIEGAGIPAYLSEAVPTAERPVVPDRYATYDRLVTTCPMSCDDAIRFVRHSVRVDLYDSEDPSEVSLALVDALLAGGFKISGVRDLREWEGAGYRVRISAEYYEERL